MSAEDSNDVYTTDAKGHLVVKYLIASDVKRLQFKVCVVFLYT